MLSSAKTARSGFASCRVCILTSVVRRCEVEGTECALTDLHADFCSFACTAKFTGVHLLLSALSRGSLLSHPCLTHLSSRLWCPLPPSPHTPGPLPSPIPGEMTLSMKQTRTNLASASALWMRPLSCDVTERKLFGVHVCMRARVRACDRERMTQGGRACVMQQGFACVWDMHSG